jgi:hypothetical protein
MKKVLSFLVIGIFLISSVIAVSINGSVDSNVNANSDNKMNGKIQVGEDIIVGEGKIKAGDIVAERNRIRVNNFTECPENCTCSGSTTRCQFQDGREMTIRAGNSGNTIVQVRGVNMSTDVTLYKSEKKVYGVFKNNQTKRIGVLPDEVKDKVRERIRARLENHNITLDEEGVYQIQARKQARLFFVVPVKEKVKIQMNSETGEIIRTKTSWWGFMARDVKDNPSEEDESS